MLGLGNWGTSLAAALDGASLLAMRSHAKPASRLRGLDASILWLCVPDTAISATAERIAAQRSDLRGKLVVHSSGALDRQALHVLQGKGARTASVHPMMSFPSRRVVSLGGTRFAIEAAEPSTLRILRAIVRRIGGQPFSIQGSGKALYHAGAMFGSPLLLAALDAGVRCLEAAGLPEPEALALLCPMAAATIANAQLRGLQRSFSGPLARGDAAAIQLHRQALLPHPLEAQVYRALGALAARDLPSTDRSRIAKEFEEAAVIGHPDRRRGTRPKRVGIRA